MKYTAILATAAAAVASAQVTYNETTGAFTCAAANPNGAFCAGDSLKTNIIIRCTDGVGQPGNCNNNLAGYFPYGVRFAACYQSSPTAGDAACSKNCIVHAPAGDFTLPGCTPESDPSSTQQPTSSAYSTPSTSNYPTTTPSAPPPPPPTNETTTTTTITVTGTTTCITDGSTVTSTYTTVYCPKCQETVVPSLTTTTFIHSGTGSPAPPTNATIPTTGPATATPVGPTTTIPSPPTEFTGAASMNSAGSFLIGLGFAAAYFI